MSTRIHIVLDEAEKQRFRRHAERRGTSLSAWLREAARSRADREEEEPSLDDLESLDAFFDDCDGIESGPEPDWEEHKRRIDRSVRSGSGGA